MDALKLLTDDHETVRDLFAEFRAAKDRDDRKALHELQQKIFEELETHSGIEETIFYPAIRDLEVDEITETVNEGLQEHHVVKVLMREVENLSDHDVFVAKMTVLIENVEHHATEEEDELFPDVRDHMSQEQLEELGRELEKAKGK